jgi:hypothetical protein
VGGASTARNWIGRCAPCATLQRLAARPGCRHRRLMPRRGPGCQPCTAAPVRKNCPPATW